MILQALFFALGLVALYFGAEWLVQGASRLARALGVSALVVGLTVVSLGTSAPELIVSLLAALGGQSDVAMGNVVGSNIGNIALVLAMAAVIYPLRVQARLVLQEIPLMVAASVLLMVLALGGLSRLDGAILLGGLVAYLLFLFYMARRQPEVASELAGEVGPETGEYSRRARGFDAVAVLAGLVLLSVGARLLVDSATFFARSLGIAELTIGLTVVAIGTSLPELATSVLAAVRRQTDIAVGNAVGSNIFNVLGILGVTAMAQPIEVAPALYRFEFPVLIGVSLLLLPLAWTRWRIERWEGAALLLGYAAFLGFLLLRGA